MTRPDAPYNIPEPNGGWRHLDSFSDDERRKLRPIAETLAMLDGNAFFEMENADRPWADQYLPEAAALYQSNGGDEGWAGGASFAKRFTRSRPHPTVDHAIDAARAEQREEDARIAEKIGATDWHEQAGEWIEVPGLIAAAIRNGGK